MKRVRTIILFSTTICFMATAISAAAQTNAQKGKKAPIISTELKIEIDKLKSDEMAQRLDGAYNLGNMGEKAAPAIPSLLEVIQRNEGLKDVAKESLKYFEKDTSFLVFGGNASTINPSQIVASDALAKIGKPAIEPLRAALLQTDPDDLYIYYAARSLSRMQEPTATKILHDTLKNETAKGRMRVAEALAYSKDPISVEVLIWALKDNDAKVKSASATSLKRITGQSFGEDHQKWEEWWVGNKPKGSTDTQSAKDQADTHRPVR